MSFYIYIYILFCNLHSGAYLENYTISGYYHPQYKIINCKVPSLIALGAEIHGQKYKPLVTLSWENLAHCQHFGSCQLVCTIHANWYKLVGSLYVFETFFENIPTTDYQLKTYQFRLIPRPTGNYQLRSCITAFTKHAVFEIILK